MAHTQQQQPPPSSTSSHHGSSPPTIRISVVMYSAYSLERTAMEEILAEVGIAQYFNFTYVTARLDEATAALSANAKAVILFAGDSSHRKSVLQILRDNGVELIVLRYAGKAAVDEKVTRQLGLKFKQVVSSRACTAVAEYVISLILALQRQMVLLAARSRSGNLHQLNSDVQPILTHRIIGIIGTDKVGCHVIRVLRKFGCKVLAFDVIESKEALEVGAKYVSFDRLLAQSDVISLHVPPGHKMKSFINETELNRCKQGVHIINTGFLDLVNLKALLNALENRKVGAFAADLFDGTTAPMFRPDELDETRTPNFDLEKLKQMQNVIITAHQSTMSPRAQKEIAHGVVNILAQFYDIDLSSTHGSANSTTS